MAALSSPGPGIAAEAQPAEMADEMDDMADDEPEFARDFSTYQPSATATRIEAREAPTIDGLLDDPAWARAQVIEEFYQLEPDTGQAGVGTCGRSVSL